MTRASWDLLSTLLYGRPGQELPPYVARRAAEIDTYLHELHLPADSPIVLAHAESIIALYRQDERDQERWAALQRSVQEALAALPGTRTLDRAALQQALQQALPAGQALASMDARLVAIEGRLARMEQLLSAPRPSVWARLLGALGLSAAPAGTKEQTPPRRPPAARPGGGSQAPMGAGGAGRDGRNQ